MFKERSCFFSAGVMGKFGTIWKSTSGHDIFSNVPIMNNEIRTIVILVFSQCLFPFASSLDSDAQVSTMWNNDVMDPENTGR